MKVPGGDNLDSVSGSQLYFSSASKVPDPFQISEEAKFWASQESTNSWQIGHPIGCCVGQVLDIHQENGSGLSVVSKLLRLPDTRRGQSRTQPRGEKNVCTAAGQEGRAEISSAHSQGRPSTDKNVSRLTQEFWPQIPESVQRQCHLGDDSLTLSAS